MHNPNQPGAPNTGMQAMKISSNDAPQQHYIVSDDKNPRDGNGFIAPKQQQFNINDHQFQVGNPAAG